MAKLSKIYSVVTIGLKPQLVEAEVDIGAGIPSLTIVGSFDKAAEETKEKVKLALKITVSIFQKKDCCQSGPD